MGLYRTVISNRIKIRIRIWIMIQIRNGIRIMIRSMPTDAPKKHEH